MCLESVTLIEEERFTILARCYLQYGGAGRSEALYLWGNAKIKHGVKGLSRTIYILWHTSIDSLHARKGNSAVTFLDTAASALQWGLAGCSIFFDVLCQCGVNCNCSGCDDWVIKTCSEAGEQYGYQKKIVSAARIRDRHCDFRTDFLTPWLVTSHLLPQC